MSLPSVNPHLLQAARASLNGHDPLKTAFVPGDAMAGGAGAPPGQDMSGGGGAGAPPPTGGEGQPPPMPDPTQQPGAGPQPDITMMVHQAVQQAMAMNSGAGGGGMGKNPMTPKIDEKAAILQILKILALVADALGVRIPASEMVVSTGDMTSFANQQSQQQMGGGMGAGAPGGPPPGGGSPPITPPQPMGPMAGTGGSKMGQYLNGQGDAFDASSLMPAVSTDSIGRTEALAHLLARRQKAPDAA